MLEKVYDRSTLELIVDDMRCVDVLISKSTRSNLPFVENVAKYIISAGGKRLRPIVTLLAARMCKEKTDRPPMYAACIELIHTATLLHDDVIDESALRRGEKSAHTIWGDKATVLVGDFLFTRAFNILVQANVPIATKNLTDAVMRIVEGEISQLSMVRDFDMQRSAYLRGIETKTAVLFSSACEVGGILGGVGSTYCRVLRAFGKNLGMAFQLVDDAMDYSSSNVRMGKNIGDDFKEGKITLPILIVMKHANAEERSFVDGAMSHGKNTQQDLKDVQILIKKYQAIERTYDLARAYINKAKKHLKKFDSCPHSYALFGIADAIVKT